MSKGLKIAIIAIAIFLVGGIIVISLMATESVVGVVDEAKAGADTSAAKMLLSAGKNYSAIAVLDGTNVAGTTVSCKELDMDMYVPSVTKDAGWSNDVATDCGVVYDADGNVSRIYYGSAFNNIEATIEAIDAIY